MSNDDRIAVLEREIAELRTRDERREREHRSLLERYVNQAKDQDNLRTELETTMQLRSNYLDTRVIELTGRARDAGGTVTIEMMLAFAKEMGAFVLDTSRPLVDRIARQERLIVGLWTLLEPLTEADPR